VHHGNRYEVDMKLTLINWFNAHRWIFCMNPAGWSVDDEQDYQDWLKQQPDWRGIYGRPVTDFDWPGRVQS